MTLHATARAKALVHGLAITGVAAVTMTGFLYVDRLGEQHRCDRLVAADSPAAVTYGCQAPKTSTGADTSWGSDTSAPVVDSSTPAATAPRPVSTRASRSRIETPATGMPLAWADTAKARAVAYCESSGDPKAVSASGTYRGKWQMDADFWRTYGGLKYAARPDLATEDEQDRVAHAGWLARGWQPWTCG